MPKMSLNNVKLRDKMLILYFLCVLIPIVLTNLIFYHVTTSNVKKQKMNDISISLEKAKTEFRDQIDVAVGIASVLNTDYFLNEALETQYANASQYVDKYHSDIFFLLNKYAPVHKAIKGITIYTDNDTVLPGGYVLPLTPAVMQSAWYQKLAAMPNSYTPLIVRSDEFGVFGYENIYSVVRELNYYAGQSVIRKIVKIDLHSEAIRQIFASASFEGDVYLLDDRGVIQYTSDETVEWRFREAAFRAEMLPSDAMLFEETYSNEYLKSLRLVLAVSEQEVLEAVRNSRDFVIYLAIPNIVVPTLIILLITRSFNTRMVRVLRHMKKVKNGSFETVPSAGDRDEIGQLTMEFNRMTMQIKRLIDEVYVADIQRKDLELKRRQSQLHALQSQINPHFLFNSLSTIRMRSLMKGEEETARIIHNMAKMFRKSLEWGKDWVTIKEEMDLVLCFLEIQKYRFGDKLNYNLYVDEAAADRMIPKMMLQPLVENASIHGIEPLKSGGCIDVRAEARDGFLYFTVRDNGVGIAPDALKRVQESWKDGDRENRMGENIGMKNVYYRLMMYFEGEAEFDIASAPGEGTTIRIRVPDVKDAGAPSSESA
ncbi:sensor histidine kinase [Paenibacillus sp.]|uniref:sensor histidine kinase n=1 Tax=Paenibacillus sp. TaxID=58172 RepID=UPI002D2F5B6B|nr:sensor histidine kinase [Paenibacillus sp.]HZG87491.1 sensor histidine kinase [Paenibacillus sp.]